MRQVRVTIDINVPSYIGDDEVAGYINKMLEIGYSDAADTAEDDDLDNEEARAVLAMEIGQPSAITVNS